MSKAHDSHACTCPSSNGSLEVALNMHRKQSYEAGRRSATRDRHNEKQEKENDMTRPANVAATSKVQGISLVTQMLVAEKYGLRLNVNQLAQLLDITPGTVLNRISANTFNIPTYIDHGKRYADYRDVAKHFDIIRNNMKKD